MKSQEELLDICKALVEQKFAHDSSENWRNETFISLSKDIFECTKINISHDTLKRLFGKRKATLPQPSTRNALALYIGFKDWVDFVKSHNPDFVTPKVELDIKNLKNQFGLWKSNKTKIVFISILILVVSLTFYFLLFTFLKGNIQLQVTNNEGKVPLYVKYKFKNTGVFLPDSFTLDLGYDDWLFPHPVEKVLLSSRISEFNESYQIPDFHHVRLSQKDKLVDSCQVYSFLDEWVGLAGFPYHYFDEFKYIKKDGFITFDTTYMQSLGFISNKHFISEFRYYFPISINGDSFEASALVELSEVTGGKSCYDLYFDIECQNGIVSLQFVESGCEKFAHFELSEVKLDGRFSDLSAFGKSFEKPKTIKIKVQDNNLSAFMNDASLFQHNYNQKLGEIKGVRVRFKGIGRLYKVQITDLKNKTTYLEDFD